MAVLFCWTTLTWNFCRGRKRGLPRISSYPVVGFSSKLDMQEVDEEEVSLELRRRISIDGEDKAIRNELADVVVRFRHAAAL